MRLSDLQKYILKKVWNTNKIKKVPTKNLQIKIITKSIERLIDKGLMIGYGEKTQYKLFIKQVKLTSFGKKVTKKLFGEQIKLPFKK